MDTLLPLLSRIEDADRLIDQVVYRLYGLTEEEIRVVEQGEGLLKNVSHPATLHQ